MAESRFFSCNECGKSVEAWSDGNQYYLDGDGRKRYAYHPDHENLAKCIGNDTPHVCLSCGYEFKVDSLSPLSACSKCKSGNITDQYHLSGERCPSCNIGVFHIDHDRFSIS